MCSRGLQRRTGISMNRTFFAVSAIFFLCSCHATPVPQCPTNSVCVLAEQHEALTKFSINNQAQKIYSIPPLMGLRTHTSTIEIRLFSDDDGYEKQTISLRTVIVPLHKTASSIPLVPGASFSLSVPADDLK